MKIILGIFSTKYFDPIKYNALPFSRFSKIYRHNGEDLKVYLAKVMFEAKEIVFMLDDVETPISPIESVTCFELSLILNSKSLFKKTEFYLEGEKLEKQVVLSTYSTINCLKFKKIFNQFLAKLSILLFHNLRLMPKRFFSHKLSEKVLQFGIQFLQR